MSLLGGRVALRGEQRHHEEVEPPRRVARHALLQDHSLSAVADAYVGDAPYSSSDFMRS